MLSPPRFPALTHTVGFISFSSFSVNNFIATVLPFSQVFNHNPNLTIKSLPNVIYGVVIRVEKMVDINKEGGDLGMWPWGLESPMTEITSDS